MRLFARHYGKYLTEYNNNTKTEPTRRLNWVRSLGLDLPQLVAALCFT
jgi:hypothetical protein